MLLQSRVVWNRLQQEYVEHCSFDRIIFKANISLVPCFAIESPIKSKDIDFSLYTTKTLTPDFKIHWRILKEQKEIEMVLVVNGTSWVGFGWRPKKLTAECRKFPVLHDIGAAVPEPSSEPEPTSEPEPSGEPKSEPSSPRSEPEPKSVSEPASEPSSEPRSEPTAKSLEPLALGSSKSKRVASPQTPNIPSSKDEYTVSTSVSYRVSTVTGRRKRAAQSGKNSIRFKSHTHCTSRHTLDGKLLHKFNTLQK